jgi:hypothetical protein
MYPGRGNNVSLMVCGPSRLFGTGAGYILSGVEGERLWSNEEWDVNVMDEP